jgi:hypothetical protein
MEGKMSYGIRLNSTQRSSVLKMGLSIVTLLVGVSSLAESVVEMNAPVSAARKRAALIYNRLAGESVHIDSQILRDMEALIAAGKDQEAAALVTNRPQFYNNTLRFFGQRLTTKQVTSSAPFTDMVATILGVAKDDLDARVLLQTESLYRVNLPGAPVAPADYLSTNRHYEFAQTAIEQNSSLDLRPVLVPARQQVLNSDNNGVAVNHPEPAGILTSRAFSAMCASAGTNRRCYEEAMKKFMCINLESFADTNAPDGRVGRDVSRAPGGDPKGFQNTCRGCHGNMDAMRSAFAYIEYDQDKIKHGRAFTGGNLFDGTTRVAVKYNRIAPNDGFPGGFVVTDNSYENNLMTGSSGTYFGWRDNDGKAISQPILDSGVISYGRMVSNSVAFSNCLVKKAFVSTCKRDPASSDTAAIRTIASEFETKGQRKLRWLFGRLAVDPACTGN